MLFLAYRHYVKAIAFRHAPMPQLADEIVQQVFAHILEKADQLDFSKDFRAFLSVTTQNIARNYWKAESRHFGPNMRRVAEYICRLAEDQMSSTSEAYSDELDALQRCLEGAPEKSRKLISLHYFGGKAMFEIAREMNLSQDAVYQAFFRLREKLRTCVERTLHGGRSHE